MLGKMMIHGLVAAILIGGAAAVYAQADTVLAYGGNDALDEIRRQLPVTTRFLPYGHKLGFGAIGTAALDSLRGPATARPTRYVCGHGRRTRRSRSSATP